MLADLLLPYFDYGLRGSVFLENLTVDYVFQWRENGLVGLGLGLDELLEVVFVDLDHAETAASFHLVAIVCV